MSSAESEDIPGPDAQVVGSVSDGFCRWDQHWHLAGDPPCTSQEHHETAIARRSRFFLFGDAVGKVISMQWRTMWSKAGDICSIPCQVTESGPDNHLSCIRCSRCLHNTEVGRQADCRWFSGGVATTDKGGIDGLYVKGWESHGSGPRTEERRKRQRHWQCVKQTVEFAVNFTGSRAFGPASALKLYLSQVGWNLQMNGTIHGPEHFSCNLLTDSTKFFCQQVQKDVGVIFAANDGQERY